MFKKYFLIFLILESVVLSFATVKTTSPDGVDLSGLVQNIFKNFNQVRDIAESTASENVRDIEKTSLDKTNNITSNLVKGIFKNFNMVVDKAEDLADQVFNKVSNLNTQTELTKKRDAKFEQDNFNILKNETLKLASTFKKDVVGISTLLLSGIFKNIKTIVDKINIEIEDKIDDFNLTKIVQNVEFPQEVTEIIEKRSIANETELIVKKLFFKFGKIMNKVTDKIEESIANTNWTLSSSSDNVVAGREVLKDTEANVTTVAPTKEIETDMTTIAPTTTTNKYMKIGEYYKNKFAGKYLNVPEETKERKRRELNMTEINEKYAVAGKDFSASLGNLVVELIESFLNGTSMNEV